MRTRRALILLPSSGPLITETAVGSGCAITVNFPSDGSPVLRSGRRPLRFSAAFDPVGGRRPRRSSCMQRFAVRLNRNAASILALAHEVFSVRGTLRRYGWINSASRYKSPPQLELYAPTANRYPSCSTRPLFRTPAPPTPSLSSPATRPNRAQPFKALRELQRLQAARRAEGYVSPPVAIDVEVSRNATKAPRKWVCLAKTRHLEAFSVRATALPSSVNTL